ncbi:phosphopantetheine-binding protein [Actinokineospora sp. G85]|uniref:phosphopantetheine-binding protein n=1 Tax=Actinokineospora sp. G85 TaxID=3406626 RepID=UPI003C761E5B
MDANEVDEVVAAEWSAVLDVDDPRPADDFFAVGGNSLLAVSLIERVEAKLGVELPIDEFFVEGTLASLRDLARAAAAG